MYSIKALKTPGYYEYFYSTKNEFGQNLSLSLSVQVEDDYAWWATFYITTKRRHGYKIGEQTGKDGIKSLLWAKECLKDFIKLIKDNKIDGPRTIAIYGEDMRRYKIYEHYLKDLGFKTIKKKTLMYKID